MHEIPLIIEIQKSHINYLKNFLEKLPSDIQIISLCPVDCAKEEMETLEELGIKIQSPINNVRSIINYFVKEILENDLCNRMLSDNFWECTYFITFIYSGKELMGDDIDMPISDLGICQETVLEFYGCPLEDQINDNGELLLFITDGINTKPYYFKQNIKLIDIADELVYKGL